MATTDESGDDLMGTPGLEATDEETISKTECCVASVIVENVDGRVVLACDDCGQRNPPTKPYNVSDLQAVHEN